MQNDRNRLITVTWMISFPGEKGCDWSHNLIDSIRVCGAIGVNNMKTKTFATSLRSKRNVPWKKCWYHILRNVTIRLPSNAPICSGFVSRTWHLSSIHRCQMRRQNWQHEIRGPLCCFVIYEVKVILEWGHRPHRCLYINRAYWTRCVFL